MSLSVGIVGLPNAGKSTLFQAITKNPVLRADYPFSTIDPNTGFALVLDKRIDEIALIGNSAKKTFAFVEFIDIAGLVKGASKGQGLGNRFLSHIRETDAALYVLRAFSSKQIPCLENKICPLKEKEILDTELILKDQETIEKIISGIVKQKTKEAIAELGVLEKARDFLNKDRVLAEKSWSKEEEAVLKTHCLLTFKPRLYLINGKDRGIEPGVVDFFEKNNLCFLILDVLFELEAGGLSKEERIAMGLPEFSGINALVQKIYELLGLITFFTANENETRARTLKKGESIKKAAGLVHSDFEENFIKADVARWKDFVACAGWQGARKKGLARTEGKNYIVEEGDIIEIKHG